MSMSLELSEWFLNAGVSQHVLDKLTEDELYTEELIDSSSDVLLKECGIKAGQIVKLRIAVQGFKNKVLSLSDCSAPSTPRTSAPSTPRTSASTIGIASSSDASPQSVRSSTPLSKASFSQPPSPLSTSSCASSSRPSGSRPSSPMTFFDDVVPSFNESEVSKDTKWVQNFQLPSKFSKPVTDALQSKGFMKSNVRNEFTRDVCSSIRAHTFYPTKTEREHVAMMIIKKYPFLADKMGSGIGSWEQAIKNNIKNKRKSKPATGVKRNNQNLQTKQPEIKAKKIKTTDVGKLPQIQAGETKETCREHVLALKKEMRKTSNKKMSQIRDLMELTFPIRRQSILMEPTAIADGMEEYPALSLVSEFKAEFGRVMDDKNIAKSMAEKMNFTWIPKLLNLARDKSSCKELMEEMEEGISNNANKSAIKETVALMALPILMKERGSTSDILKVCDDNECIDDGIAESIAPRLVGAGEIGDVSPLYIAGEGRSIIKLNNSTSMINALVMLVGCYYIFNIEYPTSTRNVFLFLEAVMLEKTCEVKKRVAINKFLQELE